MWEGNKLVNSTNLIAYISVNVINRANATVIDDIFTNSCHKMTVFAVYSRVKLLTMALQYTQH